MQCVTCSGTGRRTKYVEYIGHQTLGPCDACAGTGEGAGESASFSKEDLIPIIAAYADATIPARMVGEVVGGGLGFSLFADAFSEIEQYNRPVDHIVMHPSLLYEVRSLFDANTVINSHDSVTRLWGVRITTDIEVPENIAIVMTASDYMYHMGEEPEEGPEDLVACAVVISA